jgi:glucose/mannose-6-phosphate isomerase
LFSLALLGDLASLYVAAAKGVDPTPVASIDAFKRDLA